MSSGVFKSRNSAELLDKEMAVLKATSGLSEQEIRQAYNEFMQESPSGRMTMKQFKKIYKQLGDPLDKHGVISENAFRLLDVNHDGTIDFSEFVASFGLEKKKDLNAQLELMFSMLDKSNDGYISYHEMVKFMKFAKVAANDDTMTDTPKEMASTIFQIFGVSDNQQLSKKQFIDGCKANKALTEMFGPA